MDTPPSFSALIWVSLDKIHAEDRGQNCIGIRICNIDVDENSGTSSFLKWVDAELTLLSHEQRSNSLQICRSLFEQSFYKVKVCAY